MAVLLTLAVLIATAAAYPSGAPDDACSTLDPVSHGPSTATGNAPYALTFSSSTYQPNQVITVQLQGSKFKGFLIVGRKSDGSSTDPIGYFINPTSDSQLICLNSTTGNGITHTDNSVKAGLTFSWKAPSSSVGDVVFHYTIVRGGAPSKDMNPADYYKDEQSAAIKPASTILLYKLKASRVSKMHKPRYNKADFMIQPNQVRKSSLPSIKIQ
ncbi:putative ferric-chelate reductase 1 isoform X2 [Physella acuta]|uniref:putative ferric-chelate reductase 1 isoform X2 n=1 Tax=Physella acuta TaxID=109671 RepID=UPI0027DB8339|nr:putative ferric-chelate reductase 1 isoform X2 [Physella acuta]